MLKMLCLVQVVAIVAIVLMPLCVWCPEPMIFGNTNFLLQSQDDTHEGHNGRFSCHVNDCICGAFVLIATPIMGNGLVESGMVLLQTASQPAPRSFNDIFQPPKTSLA